MVHNHYVLPPGPTRRRLPRQCVTRSLVKRPRSHNCVCDRIGILAPLLPVHVEEKWKLFCRLVRTTRTALDFDHQITIAWCAHVDDTTMLPKLLVYLRTHRSLGTSNQRVRKAVEAVARGEVERARINKEAQHEALFTSPAVPSYLTPTPCAPAIASPATISTVVYPPSRPTPMSPLPSTIPPSLPLPPLSSPPPVSSGFSFFCDLPCKMRVFDLVAILALLRCAGCMPNSSE